jgi:hypothetical protein
MRQGYAAGSQTHLSQGHHAPTLRTLRTHKPVHTRQQSGHKVCKVSYGAQEHAQTRDVCPFCRLCPRGDGNRSRYQIASGAVRRGKTCCTTLSDAAGKCINNFPERSVVAPQSHPYERGRVTRTNEVASPVRTRSRHPYERGRVIVTRCRIARWQGAFCGAGSDGCRRHSPERGWASCHNPWHSG